MLIMGMTASEIRVLQEFRRVGASDLNAATINAIKHPAGGAENPAASLTTKGFLTTDDASQQYSLTARAREFLAIDAKPENEAPASEETPAEA